MAKRPLSKKESADLLRLRKEGELPHLYSWKWYSWAWQFFQSTNRFNFLCAANQISKSSTQIRKAIYWATNNDLWPKLWPNHKQPTQFLYLYPSKPVATTEFYEKWVPEFLPRGKMKSDPIFGWKEETKNKEIWAVHFNSGISIYFKTYAQDTQDLQTSTIFAIFADEEMPVQHYQELRSRLIATNGYFHMVFTATIGQEEWRRTIEPRNEAEELHRGALKIQVSMYDCLKYKDGSPSHWTRERIREIEKACASEAEVQKRVYGKFVVAEGLKFPSFDRELNIVSKQIIPEEWSIYTGVDIGTGGEKNHPAAITMIAVKPDFKFAIVFKGWRGDGVVTTASDILEKHTELCTYCLPTSGGDLIKKQYMPVIQSYDWHSRDFFEIASRAGVGFTAADKNRERGENLLNTLFKLKMLAIMDGDEELAKLTLELSSLQSGTPKTRAHDDFIDSLRYCAAAIPWDFDGVAGEMIKEEDKDVDNRSEAQRSFDERRGRVSGEEETGTACEDELRYWQELIDG